MDSARFVAHDRGAYKSEAAVLIDLPADAEAWVRREIDLGRFASAEAAIVHAIEAAKLSQLRADVAAAEAEGGAFTADEVRRSLREQVQQRTQSTSTV